MIYNVKNVKKSAYKVMVELSFNAALGTCAV